MKEDALQIQKNNFGNLETSKIHTCNLIHISFTVGAPDTSKIIKLFVIQQINKCSPNKLCNSTNESKLNVHDWSTWYSLIKNRNILLHQQEVLQRLTLLLLSDCNYIAWMTMPQHARNRICRCFWIHMYHNIIHHWSSYYHTMTTEMHGLRISISQELHVKRI